VRKKFFLPFRGGGKKGKETVNATKRSVVRGDENWKKECDDLHRGKKKAPMGSSPAVDYLKDHLGGGGILANTCSKKKTWAFKQVRGQDREEKTHDRIYD